MAITMAVVDIGTNSVKLTVAEMDGGALRVQADAARITRLGKGVAATGRLGPEAMARTLQALSEYAARAKELGAARVAAVGTSALRDAANGAEFVAAAQEIWGGTVEVISGDREAYLVYTSARRDPDLLPPDAGRLAVMDIGGGSTEFVEGEKTAITYRQSLQIGAVRLTERALPSDPPSPAEVRNAVRIADSVLATVPLSPEDASPITLVASGGTVANLAAMEQYGRTSPPCDADKLHGSRLHGSKLHGMRLSREQVEAWIDVLARRTVAARRGIPGLEPDRADVILAGALIQARAMGRLGAAEGIVSLRGLRFGLLYELADARI